MYDLGLTNSSLLIREGVEDSLKRAIEEIGRADINAGTTEDLRRKIILYKRKFNGLTGDYMGPMRYQLARRRHNPIHVHRY